MALILLKLRITDHLKIKPSSILKDFSILVKVRVNIEITSWEKGVVLGILQNTGRKKGEGTIVHNT